MTHPGERLRISDAVTLAKAGVQKTLKSREARDWIPAKKRRRNDEQGSAS
jgi:hypothetical protein